MYYVCKPFKLLINVNILIYCPALCIFFSSSNFFLEKVIQYTFLFQLDLVNMFYNWDILLVEYMRLTRTAASLLR